MEEPQCKVQGKINTLVLYCYPTGHEEYEVPLVHYPSSARGVWHRPCLAQAQNHKLKAKMNLDNIIKQS